MWFIYIETNIIINPPPPPPVCWDGLVGFFWQMTWSARSRSDFIFRTVDLGMARKVLPCYQMILIHEIIPTCNTTLVGEVLHSEAFCLGADQYSQWPPHRVSKLVGPRGVCGARGDSCLPNVCPCGHVAGSRSKLCRVHWMAKLQESWGVCVCEIVILADSFSPFSLHQIFHDFC